MYSHRLVTGGAPVDFAAPHRATTTDVNSRRSHLDRSSRPTTRSRDGARLEPADRRACSIA